MLLKNKQKSHSHTEGYSLLPAPCITDTNTLIPGVGVLPYINHLGMCPPPPPPPPKGMVFAPFWSGIGHGLRWNYGSVRTYLLFQFQMNTGKERVIYEFDVDFEKFFILRSNLRNDDIIS